VAAEEASQIGRKTPKRHDESPAVRKWLFCPITVTAEEIVSQAPRPGTDWM
jgi:hypothetical protein